MKKVILPLLIVVISCILSSCSTAKKMPNEEQIRSICELSTLECYYNNVAKSDKVKGKGIEHIFEKSRKFWIEYEGVARIGIDMNGVTMKIDGNNVIINMPHAKLLDIGIVTDTLNKNSYIISQDGFFNKNKITTEEQQAAITDAQKEMEKTVKNNKMLFNRAEKEAKDLIENYVNKVGEIAGKKYNIVWKTVTK